MKTSPHRISIWFFVFGLFLVVIALTTFEEKMDRSRRLKEVQSLEATFGPTPPAVHTVQEINGIKLAWQKAGIFPASLALIPVSTRIVAGYLFDVQRYQKTWQD